MSDVDVVVTNPSGPCEPWASIEDLPEGCPCRTMTSGDDDQGPDDQLLNDLLAEATDILWSRLGRPTIGICTVTIHPHTDGACGYRVEGRRFRGRSGMVDTGYLVDAVLLEEVPVHDVLEVLIGGNPLAADEYELHDGQWLVRVGGSWPTGSGHDDGAFTITYEAGVGVPPLVRDATMEIANFLWKRHCSNPNDNRIPESMDSMALQGGQYRFKRGQVQNSKIVDQAAPTLTSVQLATASYNPTGQARQTYVYSPDVAYRTPKVRSFT